MMKSARQKTMFLFFLSQLIIGFVLLLNSIPFEFVLRVFGLFLIVLSPLWVIVFRLERFAKVRGVEKQTDEEIKKKQDEPVGSDIN